MSAPTLKKYVIFLRGINVGGKKKVPMTELKKTLANLGFENIQTLLNSGNVVFETKQTTEKELVEKISGQLKKTFGFEIATIVRSFEEIKSMVELDPFREIEVNKNTRLYVSFLPEKTKSVLSLPYVSDEKDFRILRRTDREVFSFLQLETLKSVDAMAFLEKEYGKNITTRNWNTIQKIALK